MAGSTAPGRADFPNLTSLPMNPELRSHSYWLQTIEHGFVTITRDQAEIFMVREDYRIETEIFGKPSPHVTFITKL
jgi:hypothetical protein